MGDRPSKKDKFEDLMGQRLAFAKKKLDVIVAEGDAYEPFINGDAPTVYADTQDLDSNGRTSQRRREEDEIGKGWQKSSIPMQGILRDTLLSSLIDTAPEWVAKRREKPRYDELSPEDQEKCRIADRQAEIHAALLEKMYGEQNCQDQVIAALDDAMQYCSGWLETTFDKERKLPNIVWQSTENVLVDSEQQNDPFGKKQRWRAVRWTMSHEDAKILAKEKWKNPRYKFNPQHRVLDSQERDEGYHYDGERVPTDYVRLVRIYIKGNSPDLDTADLAKANDIEKVGKDDVYTGKNRVVIMECTGEWDESSQYSYIGEYDWEFPVDHDDFPIEPLRIRHSNADFYPPSIYQAGHNLQVMTNWALTVYNTDVFRSARRLVLLNKSAFDKKTKAAALYGTDNLPVLEVEGSVLDRGVKVQDFGQPNQSLERAGDMNQAQFNQVAGMNVLNNEARSHVTAKDASIRAAQGQQRIGQYASRIEKTVERVGRKCIMCARALMTAEDVAAWIGDDLMGWEEIIGPDGETVRVSPYWDDTVSDVETIRREVNVNLEPRSIRFVSPDQELADMDAFSVRQIEYLKLVSESNQGNPELAAELARAGNAFVKDYADRLHLTNADSYMIDLNAAVTQPIPQGQPQMGPEGQPVPPTPSGPAGLPSGLPPMMPQPQVPEPMSLIERAIAR